MSPWSPQSWKKLPLWRFLGNSEPQSPLDCSDYRPEKQYPSNSYIDGLSTSKLPTPKIKSEDTNLSEEQDSDTSRSEELFINTNHLAEQDADDIFIKQEPDSAALTEDHIFDLPAHHTVGAVDGIGGDEEDHIPLPKDEDSLPDHESSHYDIYADAEDNDESDRSPSYGPSTPGDHTNGQLFHSTNISATRPIHDEENHTDPRASDSTNYHLVDTLDSILKNEQLKAAHQEDNESLLDYESSEDGGHYQQVHQEISAPLFQPSEGWTSLDTPAKLRVKENAHRRRFVPDEKTWIRQHQDFHNSESSTTDQADNLLPNESPVYAPAPPNTVETQVHHHASPPTDISTPDEFNLYDEEANVRNYIEDLRGDDLSSDGSDNESSFESVRYGPSASLNAAETQAYHSGAPATFHHNHEAEYHSPIFKAEEFDEMDTTDRSENNASAQLQNEALESLIKVTPPDTSVRQLPIFSDTLNLLLARIDELESQQNAMKQEMTAHQAHTNNFATQCEGQNVWVTTQLYPEHVKVAQGIIGHDNRLNAHDMSFIDINTKVNEAVKTAKDAYKMADEIDDIQISYKNDILKIVSMEDEIGVLKEEIRGCKETIKEQAEQLKTLAALKTKVDSIDARVTFHGTTLSGISEDMKLHANSFNSNSETLTAHGDQLNRIEFEKTQDLQTQVDNFQKLISDRGTDPTLKDTAPRNIDPQTISNIDNRIRVIENHYVDQRLVALETVGSKGRLDDLETVVLRGEKIGRSSALLDRIEFVDREKIPKMERGIKNLTENSLTDDDKTELTERMDALVHTNTPSGLDVHALASQIAPLVDMTSTAAITHAHERINKIAALRLPSRLSALEGLNATDRLTTLEPTMKTIGDGVSNATQQSKANNATRADWQGSVDRAIKAIQGVADTNYSNLNMRVTSLETAPTSTGVGGVTSAALEEMEGQLDAKVGQLQVVSKPEFNRLAKWTVDKIQLAGSKMKELHGTYKADIKSLEQQVHVLNNRIEGEIMNRKTMDARVKVFAATRNAECQMMNSKLWQVLETIPGISQEEKTKAFAEFKASKNRLRWWVDKFQGLNHKGELKAFADFTESLDKGEELDKELATKLFEGAKTRMKGFMTLLKDGLPEEDVFEALKENRTKVQGQYRAIVNATAPKINGVGPSGTNGKTQSALPNGNKNGNASSSSTPPTTTPKPVAGRKRAAEDDREGETTTKKAKKDKAHGKHAQEVIELEN